MFTATNNLNDFENAFSSDVINDSLKEKCAARPNSLITCNRRDPRKERFSNKPETDCSQASSGPSTVVSNFNQIPCENSTAEDNQNSPQLLNRVKRSEFILLSFYHFHQSFFGLFRMVISNL